MEVTESLDQHTRVIARVAAAGIRKDIDARATKRFSPPPDRNGHNVGKRAADPRFVKRKKRPGHCDPQDGDNGRTVPTNLGLKRAASLRELPPRELVDSRRGTCDEVRQANPPLR